MQAVHGGRDQTRGQFRKAFIRGETPVRGIYESSEVETERESYTTDEYTSGALASDENFGFTTSRQDVVFDTNRLYADTVTATGDARGLPSTSHASAPSPLLQWGWLRAFMYGSSTSQAPTNYI